MNLSHIAKTIVANQSSGAGAINRAAVADVLTFDEMGEALRRGWIETREDGCVGIPSGAVRAGELRAAAATDNFVVQEPGNPNPDDFAHYRHLMGESMGFPSDLLGEDADPDVGDEVVVADQGKTYQASVSGRNADGSFKLSFSGADKPTRDSYRKEEMRVTRAVGKVPQPQVAVAPPANPTVPKTTTSPVAPGLATRA